MTKTTSSVSETHPSKTITRKAEAEAALNTVKKSEKLESPEKNGAMKNGKHPDKGSTSVRTLPSVAPVVESANLGDLVKYEADHRYSREAITVAAGQQLPLGSLLGRLNEHGFLTRFDPEATDGSEILAGVLIEHCDALEAPRSSVMITRYAVLSDAGIVWGELTPEQQHKARGHLTARGLLIQRGI